MRSRTSRSVLTFRKMIGRHRSSAVQMPYTRLSSDLSFIFGPNVSPHPKFAAERRQRSAGSFSIIIRPSGPNSKLQFPERHVC